MIETYTLNRAEMMKAAWLWMNGRDTAEIAFNLYVHQSDVVRQIETIKAEAKLIKARAA